MNILEKITQNKTLMTKYSADFEKLLCPIFEFMLEPKKISFEDNILVMIRNFIKRSG